MVYCNVLTLGQRCAYWFLMKILISETMAGIITSKAKKEPHPYSPFFLNSMLNMCSQNWFSQHKSNDMMIADTLNEDPNFDKLHHEFFILDLLELVLL